MISASIQLITQSTISYNTVTKILTGSKIQIKTVFKAAEPLIGDIIIDSQRGSIWRIINAPIKELLGVYLIPGLYLLNYYDFTSEELNNADGTYIYANDDSTGHALVTPIDNKLSVNWSSQLDPNIVRLALQYNASRAGVKIIKNSSFSPIDLENKIILDLSGITTPTLPITLPDYTHFNSGHSIEFFDATAMFDSKGVDVSPFNNQLINAKTDSILLDMSYHTIKFIYSGDPAIGWVF